MSGTEDYLDKLLNSVVDKEGGPADPQGAAPDSDDDFMKGFENDFLSGDDADDFLRQFEQEFAEEKEEPGTGAFSAENDMLDSLDGIVSSVQQETDAGQAPEEDEDDIMVDTLGDIPETRGMQADQEEDSLDFLVDEASAAGEQSGADTVSSPRESDQDLMKLLQSDEEMQESAEMGMQDGVNSGFGHSEVGLEDSFFGGDSGENELSLDDGDKRGKRKAFLPNFPKFFLEKMRMSRRTRQKVSIIPLWQARKILPVTILEFCRSLVLCPRPLRLRLLSRRRMPAERKRKKKRSKKKRSRRRKSPEKKRNRSRRRSRTIRRRCRRCRWC